MNISFHIVFLAALAGATLPSIADGGDKQLFRAIKNKVSPQDQLAIYSALELQQTPDGKLMLSEVCEVSPEDFDVQLRDINHDGVTEVFIVGGNTCTSGHTGSSIWLFIKSKQHNTYEKNLGFPAAAFKLRKEGSKGFPDIQVGGPGFCEAVWRWDGQSYAHYKNIPMAPGGCDHVR